MRYVLWLRYGLLPRFLSGVAPLRFTVLLNIMLCGTGLFDVLCHQNSELKGVIWLSRLLWLCFAPLGDEWRNVYDDDSFLHGASISASRIAKYLTSRTKGE